MKRRLVMSHPVTPVTSRWARCVLTLACIAGVAACSVLRLPNDNFEDVDVPVIDTGLVQTEEHTDGLVGAWLSNELMVVNAVQENPPAKSRRPWRVALFNVKTKRVTNLVEKGQFYCLDTRTELALILTNPEVENYAKDGKSLYIKLDSNGWLSYPAEQPNWAKPCLSNFGHDPQRIQRLLREGDGYIDLGRSGGIDLKRNVHLFRPGQAPIELNVQGDDVNVPLYVPFRDEYLLNQWAPNSEKSPRVYFYMSPEGKIRTEPLPEHFLQKVGKPGFVRPMKNGMLFDRSGSGRGERGLFLVRGNKIYRVFDRNVVVRRFTPSPDGCKLAFWSHREHPYADKNTVKIIDLCEGF